MNTFLKFSAFVTSVLVAGVAIISCNKDDVIESSELKPQIILDNEYGVYTVKVGQRLTISPEFINADDADITWTTDDGQIVCRTTSWTSVWDTEGEYYITISAKNRAGTTAENIRIDVMELTPPVISMRIPEGGLKVKASTDYLLSPDIQHADMEGFSVKWYVNGEEAGEEMEYMFNRSETGIYNVKIVATNIDGTSVKEFDIEVVDSIPQGVIFPTASYLQKSTTRYTFPGRPVFLRPEISNFDAPQFSWTVDGNATDCTERTFKFTPEISGEYRIAVNVTVGDNTAVAEVTVVCVDADEDDRFRPRNAGSSPYSTEVFEWTPAPGQFINDTSIFGGMTGAENTPESASEWAKTRLEQRGLVSLGSFGGYIIVGFDHSIEKSSLDYDLAIGGNAFLSNDGGSNEPGIVWVMQDVNGNGLPDDEWYELKGSDYGNPATRTNYSVTYFRPSAPKMNVEWVDSEGKTGIIKYLPLVHKQDYYYPAWITEPSYTLYGTCIPAANSVDPSTGYWNNSPYAWGYADNVGSDNIGGLSADGTGQATGFKLSNAVFADGSTVDLKYVDFVKVQVAVLAQSGGLGEISTEVSGFIDYSMR